MVLPGIMLLQDTMFTHTVLLAEEKTGQVYAGRHGLCEALDRPMAPRRVLVRGEGRGCVADSCITQLSVANLLEPFLVRESHSI